MAATLHQASQTLTPSYHQASYTPGSTDQRWTPVPAPVLRTTPHAVGIEADSDRVDALFSELEGKDIAEVVAQGLSKLASVPSGGGGGVAAGGGGGGGAAAAAGGGAAEKKEEAKKEEPEEEEEDEVGDFSTSFTIN